MYNLPTHFKTLLTFITDAVAYNDSYRPLIYISGADGKTHSKQSFGMNLMLIVNLMKNLIKDD